VSHDDEQAGEQDLAAVLLAVRLRSFAEAEVVAAVGGVSEEHATSVLDAAAARRLVVHRDGRIAGWMLTPEGRDEGERLLAAELDASGARPEVEAAYREFLVLNGALLAVCTDWQLLPSASGADEDRLPNDHADPAWDAAVVGRLGELHDQVAPVLGRLTVASGRFGGYLDRFAAALERVRAGEGEWFTKPTIPSYHTVWFELHEHLLATLGIDRSSEAGAPP
jgi:hypothetical protein